MRITIATCLLLALLPAMARAADPNRKVPLSAATPRVHSRLPHSGKSVKIRGAGYKNPALNGKHKMRLVPEDHKVYYPGGTNDANVIHHPP
jgi:hypothetical protein